jgi:hypothetical protein
MNAFAFPPDTRSVSFHLSQFADYPAVKKLLAFESARAIECDSCANFFSRARHPGISPVV